MRGPDMTETPQTVSPEARSLLEIEFYFVVLIKHLEIEIAIACFERPLDLVATALFTFALSFPFATSFRVRHDYVSV